VGIEMNDGALLAWLLHSGYTVFGIQPKSAQRARDIYRPSGSKDDRIDAFVLAEFVRLNQHRLQPLQPPSAITQELRQLVRWRQSVIQQRTAAMQRLRALLAQWSPGLSALCYDLNRIWQLQLLLSFPTEAALCQAHGNRIRSFTRKHHIRPQVRRRLEELRQALPMAIPAGRLHPLQRQVHFLVQHIQHFSQEVSQIDQDLKQLIAQHPDAHIFQSLPAGGTLTVASLLAIFGEERDKPGSWSNWPPAVV